MKTTKKILLLLLAPMVLHNAYAVVTFDGQIDNTEITNTTTFTDGGIDFQMGIDDNFISGSMFSYDHSLFYETIGPNIPDVGSIGTDGFFINTSPAGAYDVDIDPNRSLGDSFVRTGSDASNTNFGASTPNRALIIDYTSGSANQSSGEIWDIDSSATGLTEGFVVRAYDSSNSVIASDSYIAVGASDYTLDGRAWVFELNAGTDIIDYIAITWNPSATKTNGVGLAFNNFNPIAIPEPGTLVLAGILIGSFGGMHLLKRRKK
jgi:hypothetical protein